MIKKKKENSGVSVSKVKFAIRKMKANNGKGNVPLRDEWETPQDMWNKLHKQYNFKFDCCASTSNKKCKDYSRKLEEESTKWQRICWMNPPFSKAYKMFECFFKIVNKGIAIYRCDNMETKIWQELIFPNATWIFIPNRRIAYEGMEGNGSRFPSALIGLNVKEIKDLGGITLTPSEKRGT